MEPIQSPRRSRCPILARAIAMELHHLPQVDRVGLQKLHDSVRRATEWRNLAGGLEVATRLLEKLASVQNEAEDVQNFQVLVTNLKEQTGSSEPKNLEDQPI